MKLSSILRKAADEANISRMFIATNEYFEIMLLIETSNEFYTNPAFKYEEQKYTQFWRHDVQLIKAIFENSEYKVNKIDYNGEIKIKDDYNVCIKFSFKLLSQTNKGESKEILSLALNKIGYKNLEGE
jgi:hypothetical protein